MINPQLLQHLSRVRVDEEGDGDGEGNVKLSLPQLRNGNPNAILVTAIIFVCCALAFATLHRSIIVSILLVLVIAEQSGGVRVCWESFREEYKEISKNMTQSRKTKYLKKISQLLGSLGAPKLSLESVLIEDDEWIKVPKPFCETLLKLLSNQCTLLKQCDEAIQMLQCCSRFLASVRPISSLPLSLFRQQIHQVLYSNREHLEGLLLLEVVHDRSESVPSTQNLRSIKVDTLQLFPVLCERALVYRDPRLDQLRRMILETEKTSAYVTGLLGSVLERRRTTAGDCSDLPGQAYNLLSAFAVLEADFPCPQESADVWTKALHISQTITRHLQVLVEQGQPTDEDSSLNLTDNIPNSQDNVDSEITFQECNSSGASADVARELNEKLVQGNKTLVYSTTVAPRQRFRRRKRIVSPSSSQRHSPTTPFDFLDELQVRLRSMPPQPEVVEKGECGDANYSN